MTVRPLAKPRRPRGLGYGAARPGPSDPCCSCRCCAPSRRPGRSGPPRTPSTSWHISCSAPPPRSSRRSFASQPDRGQYLRLAAPRDARRLTAPPITKRRTSSPVIDAPCRPRGAPVSHRPLDWHRRRARLQHRAQAQGVFGGVAAGVVVEVDEDVGAVARPARMRRDQSQSVVGVAAGVERGRPVQAQVGEGRRSSKESGWRPALSAATSATSKARRTASASSPSQEAWRISSACRRRPPPTRSARPGELVDPALGEARLRRVEVARDRRPYGRETRPRTRRSPRRGAAAGPRRRDRARAGARPGGRS